MEREAFRDAVFARDGGQCVVPDCDHYAVDAHHLIERRLWEDGGYHLDNGVSLCNGHHLEAEANVLSPESLRKWAGITNVVLPDDMHPDHEYDKWGKIKYPRTYHLPSSPGATADDKRLGDLDSFDGQEIVLTEKLDGENTTLYRNAYHARSLDTDYHPTRTWVQNLQAKIGWEIPEGWRICGENLAGVHAIRYSSLPTFFFVFSIWNESNVCLSWDDTVDYADMLGLHTAPILYRGMFDAEEEPWAIEDFDGGTYSVQMEGYVMRLAHSFHYSEFSRSVAKYVRAGHVVNGHHWRHVQPKFNDLA